MLSNTRLAWLAALALAVSPDAMIAEPAIDDESARKNTRPTIRSPWNGPASAAGRPPIEWSTRRGKAQRKLETARVAPAWSELTTFSRSKRRTRGTQSLAVPRTGGPFVLSSFRFLFENGDHELKRLRLWPDNPQPGIEVAFHDIDANDPFSVWASFIGIGKRGVERTQVWRATPLRNNLERAPTAAEAKRLNGACMNGAGYVPLLTGFDFRHTRKDVHVRRLGALCATQRVRQCHTKLAGWRNEEEVGRCGARAREVLATTYRSVFDESERLDFDDFAAALDPARKVGGQKVARAYWTYVPITAVDECQLFYTRDSRRIRDFSRGRPIAIQGFDFRFLDTDHHIAEIGVTPTSGGSEQLRFRDNGREDPFEARVQLCAMKRKGSAPLPVVAAPPRPARKPLAKPGLGRALRFLDAAASTRGARGEAVADAAIAGTPLLSSFYLGFTNGDHKIQSIGVEPVGSAVRFLYRDRNGDDPFVGRASYVSAVGSELPVRRFRSEDEFGTPNSCTSIDNCRWVVGVADDVPKTFVPILSGFAFDRKATDANVASIRVGWQDKLQDLEGAFDASLKDANGYDHRDPFSPKDRSAREPYFRGSVALVPRSRVERCDRVSRSWDGRGKGPGKRRYDSVRIAAGKTFVLQDVSFRFARYRADHHLKEIGVEYLSSGELRVHFKDANRDDPYQWTVHYCFLR